MTTENIFDFENTTEPIITLRPNCSVYNPCGRNGYCRNVWNEWNCTCKFWWSGTKCDKMTNGGWQVISLGIMLAVFMILFYGTAIIRTIVQKCKQSKQNTMQPSPISTQKCPVIPVTVSASARRVLPWILIIGTILLSIITLIAKWYIIKPIHDEIVDKFKNQKRVFFKRHSFCRLMEVKTEFNVFTFPLACFIILIFAVITKRVSPHCTKFCKGYIGIPVPLDFFAHIKRGLAAVIFTIFADELLNIANAAWSGDNPSSGRGVILVYLLQILRVFVIGFRCYPILAAVYINNWFSLTCATLFIWFDFSMTIAYNNLCKNDYYQSEEEFNKTLDNKTIKYLNYYGAGSKLLFIQLLTDAPRYLCLAYLSITLPTLLFKRIRLRDQNKISLTREQRTLLYSSLPSSVEARYVKRLLGSDNTIVPTSRFSQTFRFIYEWRDDFRFSARVVCVYASTLLLVFLLTIQFCVSIPPSLAKFHDDAQELIDTIALFFDPSGSNTQNDKSQESDFPLPDFVRPFLIACIAASVIIIIQLFVMIAGIRRNLLQAYRGDDAEIPRRRSSQNLNYIAGTFHFAGYLIGYVIIGFFLLTIFFLIILIAIDSLITFGSVRLLEALLKIVIPTTLLVLFKLYVNKLLGKYAFLQHHGEVLSLNNRRAFMVFIYFNYFLDAFLGFIAAIMRILRSVGGGILYMCRLDYSPLGRKLETIDAGFNAYCGFIFVECAHRHPVLLYFVSHLLRAHLYPGSTKRLSKAQHKWHLAVFLLNNPTLIYRRKRFISRLEEAEMKLMLIGRKNMNKIYVEKPPILAHRASLISAKDVEELWDRRRF